MRSSEIFLGLPNPTTHKIEKEKMVKNVNAFELTFKFVSWRLNGGDERPAIRPFIEVDVSLEYFIIVDDYQIYDGASYDVVGNMDACPYSPSFHVVRSDSYNRTFLGDCLPSSHGDKTE